MQSISRLHQTVSLVLIAAALWVAAHTVWTPWSYWFDELFSVTMSGQSLSGVLSSLMQDVHPPLYQLLLKGVIQAVGDAEPTLRTLSWLFATAGLAITTLMLRRYGNMAAWFGALLFATNWLYPYYATEVRSYAMMLALSSLTCGLFLNRRSRAALLVCCLLLSLTHYFGLIVAGIILAAECLTALRARRGFLAPFVTGLLALVWPICHFKLGQLGQHTGGSFWIKVDSPLDTLAMYAVGYIPGHADKGIWLIVPAVLMAGAYIWRQIAPGQAEARQETAWAGLRAFYVVVATLLVVMVIDQNTPMSTPKNYVVLMPPTVMLLAITAQLAWQRSAKLQPVISVVLCLYCAVAVWVSHDKIERKTAPFQNWKEASAYIVEHAQGRKICFYVATGSSKWDDVNIANHYLVQQSGGKLRADHCDPVRQPIHGPYLVLYGQNPGPSQQRLTEALGPQNIQLDVRPKQSTDRSNGAVGVFVVNAP